MHHKTIAPGVDEQLPRESSPDWSGRLYNTLVLWGVPCMLWYDTVCHIRSWCARRTCVTLSMCYIMCYTQYVLHYVLHPVCVTLCVTPSMCYTICYTQWYDIGCHAVPDGYVLHPGQSIFLMIHITALQSAAWEGRPHTYKYTNTSTNVYKYRYKYIAYTKI